MTTALRRRYLVGIAGVPGSGKSTLAAHLQARINALTGGAVAAAVPMDGYHLTRAQLDAMPDPEEAHMRRGAPWTFDPGSYLATLRSLRTPGAGEWDWRWCAVVGWCRCWTPSDYCLCGRSFQAAWYTEKRTCSASQNEDQDTLHTTVPGYIHAKCRLAGLPIV